MCGACVLVLAEPNGGVEGALPHDHHLPVVPELLDHPVCSCSLPTRSLMLKLVRSVLLLTLCSLSGSQLPEQDGRARGEDQVLAPRGLLPRVRRAAVRPDRRT